MSKAGTDFWYVSERGTRKGPYTKKMVQERVSRGEFSKSALVWSSGQSAWQPIAIHFHFDEPVASPITVTTSPERFEIKPEPPFASKAHALLRWGGLATGIVAAVICCTGIPFSSMLDPDAYLTARIFVLVVLVVGGATAGIAWWRLAVQLSAQQSGQKKVIAVIAITAFAVVAFIFAMNTPLLYRLQVARASFRHFDLQTDVLSGTIRINGLIGPGLSSQLAVQLASNAGVHQIEINSFGGLVDEALAAAHVIESHGGLAVEATGACNSSCLLIFMAGEKRIAPATFNFGFHATSAITPIKGAYNVAALTELSADADNYLIIRGVPKSFVDGARTLGPEKLYSVSAIRMAEVGAVTQLTDQGSPVTEDKAKWIAVVGDLGNAHLPKEEMELFRVINQVAPSVGQSFASALWSKIDQHDVPGEIEVIHSVINDMVGKALPAAGDDAVSDAVASLSGELQFIRNNGRWDVCTGFLAGKGFGNLTVPSRLAAVDFSVDAELVKSAAEHGWVKQGVPTWASTEGPVVTKIVATNMLSKGENLQALSSDQRVACDWTANLLTAMVGRPPHEAAGLYRWLVAQK